MKSDNIYKKLRFIALCLAIICMVLSLIKKVKAEEISNFTEYINECYNISRNYHTEYTDNVLNEIINNSVGFYEFYNNNNEHLFVFSNYDYAQGYIYNQRFNPNSFSETFNMTIGKELNYYYGNGSLTMFYSDTNHRVNITDLTIYSIFTSPNELIIYKGVGVQGKYWQTLSEAPGYYITFENNRYKFNNSDGTWVNSGLDSSTFTASHYHSIGNNVIGSYYSDSFRAFTSPEIYTDDMINSTNENTDGLKVYKQTIHNTSYLYIDYSDCVNILPTYLETSSVFGNIDIDGTIYEIDYDSSSQYYHINIGTGKVYYQIPFNSLSLNDDNIESAILNDLEISVAWSTTLSQGDESLIWVTPIYLIGSPHDTPGYTPDSSSEQPQQTYTPEMNAEYYLEIYSMYNDGHTGDPFKYNENINLYSSHQLALDSIKMQADILEMDTWYISSVDKELYASNSDLFGDYIYDNGFGLFYDAIVFDVYDRHVDGVVNPVNIYKGTGVLYTEKYYTRNGLNTLTDSLKDVIQYDKMCSDYLYLLYDVTWKKLKSIDYNIADYFTKQGNVTSQIILILENINSFLPDIKGILDDILDALKNLQLTQLDAIDSKLTTIIDNISTPNTPFNEDDTVAEAIKYYESHNNNGVPTGQVYIDDKMSIWISGKVHLWLQGTDANTDKTNLINSVFETLTSIYDSMKNNNDIFPNIQYYLDAIAKNNNYGYETHGDFMTRFFKGNVDISTYDGISE